MGYRPAADLQNSMLGRGSVRRLGSHDFHPWMAFVGSFWSLFCNVGDLGVPFGNPWGPLGYHLGTLGSIWAPLGSMSGAL